MMAGVPTIVLLAWCMLASAMAPQQPPRDMARPALAGTASISGVVVLDAAEPRPLRRARVTLNAPDLQVGRTVVTEDDGTFVFASLPAGRYTIGASKEGYVAVNLGATRPGRPGTPVLVGDGERKRVTVRVPRGAVIAGTVTDVDGRPAQGFQVRALRQAVLNGERQMIPAGNAAVADDRGVYRIYGLPAGDYIVAGSPRGTTYAGSDLQVMTGGMLRAALDDLRGTAGAQSRPGVAESSPSGAASEQLRPFGYAAIYYPGVTTLAEASPIVLRQAEERTGVDFHVQLVPMARISGTVGAHDGTPSTASVINLVSTTAGGSAITEGVRFGRSTPDGHFEFTGVAPGRYSLMARGGSPASAGRDVSTPPLWALADVFVDGTDVADVALTLQTGYTLTGRLVFEGSRPPPADPSRTRVELVAVQSAGELTMVPSPGRVDEQGQFTIEGIMPGRYRVTALLRGSQEQTGWWLKSSFAGGRETLEAPIELRENVSGAIVTFSDRATELAGVARDSAGEPTSGCFVIAAPADRSAWLPQSRRIVAVRPSSEGKYTLTNLPPGEYLVAGVTDVEPGEWFDPRFLDLAMRGATRLTLGDAEHKAQDVVVR